MAILRQFARKTVDDVVETKDRSKPDSLLAKHAFPTCPSMTNHPPIEPFPPNLYIKQKSMGSGASITASQMEELSQKYEERKKDPGVSDETLLLQMKSEIERLLEAMNSEVQRSQEREEGEADVPDVPTLSPEEKASKELEMMVSSGKFVKGGNAKGNLSKLQTLLQGDSKMQIDVNAVDEDGWTALHHAAGEGHVKIVEFLIIEAGANKEAVDPCGCSPLWYVDMGICGYGNM